MKIAAQLRAATTSVQAVTVYRTPNNSNSRPGLEYSGLSYLFSLRTSMQVAVILNEVKNLFFLLRVRNQKKTTEILRCAQNDNGLVRTDQDLSALCDSTFHRYPVPKDWATQC